MTSSQSSPSLTSPRQVVPVVLAPDSMLDGVLVIYSPTSTTTKKEKTVSGILAEIKVTLDIMMAQTDAHAPPRTPTVLRFAATVVASREEPMIVEAELQVVPAASEALSADVLSPFVVPELEQLALSRCSTDGLDDNHVGKDSTHAMDAAPSLRDVVQSVPAAGEAAPVPVLPPLAWHDDAHQGLDSRLRRRSFRQQGLYHVSASKDHVHRCSSAFG